MSLRSGFRGATTLILASLLATACESEPSGPSQAPVDGVPVDQPRFSTRLFCEGDLGALTVSCKVGTPSGGVAGGALGDLIVGNQGTYMELASTNVAYDSVESNFSFDVTVKNLLPQPIGTTDGATLDSACVRVFFHSGPDVTGGSGTITVLADSVGTFTSTDQPYYQYDEIIPSGGTSAGKSWAFEMSPTVSTFAFTVYVAAEVPAPEGFVQLDGDSLFVEP